MTCYLIDFENVHEDGFAGIGRLEQQDVIYCFFTRNAPKISLSVLAESKGIQFRFIEAAAGKQSLDLALGSYLGYLIAQEEKGTRFVIISNDTGYLKIADFWNRRLAPNTVRECSSLEASLEPQGPQQPSLPAVKKPADRQRKERRQMVRKPTPKPAGEAQPAPAAVPAPVPAPQPAKPADIEESKAVPSPEVQPKEAAPKDDLDAAAADFVQAQIAKYAGEKNIRQLVYRAIVRKYGQKQGTRLYNSIKKTITVQKTEPANEE